jgi:mRNA-degrading endonuclease RelE of RelBE toxin-antitoxin system
MKFQINYTNEAFEDMKALRRYDQVAILDNVDRQLADQPMIETRNRKRLRPNRVAEWELRVAHFRVFYDVLVEENLVKVVGVGYKRVAGCFCIVKNLSYEDH